MKVLLLLLLLLLAGSAAYTTLPPEKVEKLKAFINSLMDCRENVGLSIALVKGNDTLYAGAFGYRDYENKLNFTATTITNIGSITKAFTATLLAYGVSKDYFTWDSPIREVIPGFEMAGNFSTPYCSIRDAMAHKIGIPSFWGLSTACLNVSRAELVRRMRDFPPLFSFRQRYHYSNYPWMLAARTLEVKDGKTWEQLIREILFDKIGMRYAKIGAELRLEDWNTAAHSHTFIHGNLTKNPEHQQLPFLNEIGPAGSVFASADDMARWMKFHLSRGFNEAGEEVIPYRALEGTYRQSVTMGTPSRRVARPQFPVDDVGFVYGMGWRMGMYRGRHKIFHSGSYSSYNCRMTLLPEAEVGVWTCVNGPGDGRASTAVYLANMFGLDLILDEEPWLNTTTACTYPWPWVPLGREGNQGYDQSYIADEEDTLIEDISSDHGSSVSSNNDFYKQVPNATHYVGEYNHPAFGTFRVYDAGNGRLRYSFGLFLKGPIRRSRTENENTLRMWLEQPLVYRMHYTDRWRWGYSIHFTELQSSAGGLKFRKISVPYLEFRLPPEFTRG